MGVIAHKEQEKNSELNDRITADLRRRAQESSHDEIDLAEDTDYTKNLQKTSHFGWIWIVLIVLALISIVIIVTI